MSKIDTDALGGIFRDLIESELRLGSEALDTIVTALLLETETFLANHADSPNYAELAEHSWVHIEQVTAINALQLEREAISRFRVAVLSVIRSVVVGLTAAA